MQVQGGGTETDLDLGHYERFIDEDLKRWFNLTTGKVFTTILECERRGEYLGSTVQMIPHITGNIKEFICSVGKKINADIIIAEISGTTAISKGIRLVGWRWSGEQPLYLCDPRALSAHIGEHKSKPTSTA